MARRTSEWQISEDRFRLLAENARDIVFRQKGGLDRERHPLRFIRKDGGVVWLETRLRYILDSSSAVQAVEGITRDVTERIEAEVNLSWSTEPWRECWAIPTPPSSRVIVARDGLEALDSFESHAREVALVVSDVVMPRMNGREFLAELRRRGHSVRVLFLTIDRRRFRDQTFMRPLLVLQDAAYRFGPTRWEVSCACWFP